MSIKTRRFFFSLTIFFAVCALMGTLVQKQVGAQSTMDESQVRDSLRSFTSVYALVEQNYADPITGEKADRAIYDGAIPGMLRVLDPHSNFYDPKAYARMREDQHGRYYGVGMLIQPQNSKIVVVTPFEGTPSYRAGIRPGDVIAAVDGKPTDNMTSEDVANVLKGPKGTHVQVTIAREGAAKPLIFDLIRDEIPHNSVELKYEIRPGIGYIRLVGFQETTAHEIFDALDSMGNIKGLVLDLRGNPGGLLSQAVDICDRWLTKGQTIVSQHGRAFPDQVYRATRGNGGNTYPIVVLVNRNTASAAEIVSGALQDHDRALIVGETTFGKGLVQTLYNLSENTGLALTTYHYYTPSGRLIQRNYEGVSLYDYYYNHAGEKPADNTNREVKLTDSGRTVYGGGGITPDEKIETPKNTRMQDTLLYHYSFFNFSHHYLASHAVSRDFKVDDAVLTEFKQMLGTEGVEYNPEEFTEVQNWIKNQIKAELFTSQFGQTEGLKIRAENDPAIEKALGFLPKAQALEEHASKVAAQKAVASNGNEN
jgi:carboxyl-terminal processing protease